MRTSVKVELTKEEKRKIGRPTTPPWELDIVAYSGRDNLLRVVECKSFLDSHGVRSTGFDGSNPEHAKIYKLFNDRALRKVVFKRLCRQLHEVGACRPNPKIEFCLACAKVRERGRVQLHAHFQKEGWKLWDEPWLREKLQQMSMRGYENQVSAVVAKLLLRGKSNEPSRPRQRHAS